VKNGGTVILIITGDRKWKNRPKIGKALYRRRKKITLVLQGGAAGADLIGDDYAKLLGIPTAQFDANWTFHGRAAGPIRNYNQLKFGIAVAKALKEQLMVLAFHSDLKHSKGTLNMVQQARKQKVLVKIIK